MMAAPEAARRPDPRHISVPPKPQPGLIAIGQAEPGCPPCVPPTPVERLVVLPHVKIHRFQHVHNSLNHSVRSASRTKRLATVTAGAALAAVAAGITASPAMAATTLASTSRTPNTVSSATGGTANHGSPFVLDAAMMAPSGLLNAPIAKAAPDGPLSHQTRASSAAPQKLPAHTQSAVSVGATKAAASNTGSTNTAAPGQSQPPAPSPPP